MKLATLSDGRIAVIEGQDVIDISSLVGAEPAAWPPVAMLHLIDKFAEYRERIATLVSSSTREKLAGVRLGTPIPWPNKVIAYPANYHEHVEEMKRGTGLISPFKANGQGFFLKANSSLSGPEDPIILPEIPGRQIHHEAELAVIIGKKGRNIPRDQAMDYVFGYSCLVDVVVRGREERIMRKSYDSFCPVGPYIVTAEEIADHTNIGFQLSINGTTRQSANTRDLIVDIPAMIEMASAVMTLFPGDIIASGTPAGVGPIEGGDRLDISIKGVGAMSLQVIQGDEGWHNVWEKSDA